MAKVSKAHKFYIQQNPEGKSAGQLSKELGIPEQTVRKYYIVNRPVKESEPVVEVKEEPVKVENPRPILDVDAAMGTIKTNNIIRGKVMTAAAAELADEARILNANYIKKDLQNATYPAKRT